MVRLLTIPRGAPMQARSTCVVVRASMVTWLVATAAAARASDEAVELGRRVFELHRAGQDDAALAAAERMVRLVERDRAASKGVKANAICNMAFCALCARQPRKALAASERALTIAPQHLLCHKNRAHALLFLGRVGEARSVYLDHKGELVGRRRWEVFVSQDFQEFRARGLDHPRSGEIERALAGAQDSARARAAPTRISRVDAEMRGRDLCFANSLVCRSGCPTAPSWNASDCLRGCDAQLQGCLDTFRRISQGMR